MALPNNNTTVDTGLDPGLSGVNLVPANPDVTQPINHKYIDTTYVDKNVEIINEPGGNRNEVQFSSSGSFKGDNGFTYDPTTKSLTVRGNITIGGYFKGKMLTNFNNFKLAGGSNGQVLVTDGFGNLSWANYSGGGGGTQGPKGDKGDPGNAGAIYIGSVTTGSSPSVVNVGTPSVAVLDFVIPKGDKGDTGERGLQGIQGNVGPQGIQGNVGPQGAKGDTGNTGARGQGFTFRGAYDSGTIYTPYDVVTYQGSTYNCIATAVIGTHSNPSIDTGKFSLVASKGDTGSQGNVGATGNAATIVIGTVTTGNAGTSVSVTNSGNTQAAILNFTIPQGNVGPQGIQGIQGIQGNVGPQGSPGATGATGSSGPQGDRGLQGLKGDKGDTGATGATGPRGLQGDPGPKGDTGATGPQGDTGPQGISVTLQGTLALISDLDNVVNPQPGDAWIVTESNGGDLYFYTPALAWDNIGKIVGPAGPIGPQGDPGERGYTGNDGADGADGADGRDGSDGTRGTVWFSGPNDPLANIEGLQDLDLYFNTTSDTVWQYSAGIQTWYLLSTIKGDPGQAIVQGITPPDNPTEGNLWFDDESGRLYIYYQNTWVDASIGGGGSVSVTEPTTNYGDSNVAAYLVANPQPGTYSDSNVSTYLTDATISTSGNITANIIVANNLGNLSALNTDGNSSNVLYGNGIFAAAPVTYGDSNVADYLTSNPQPGTYSNSNVSSYLSTATINTTGNITGNYIIGNGSQLTGLPAGYSNSNVTILLSSFGSNTITTTGNITAGNLLFTGGSKMAVSGNSIDIIAGSGAGSYAELLSHNGVNAVWVDDAGAYVAVNASAQWTFDTDSYLKFPAAGSTAGIKSASGTQKFQFDNAGPKIVSSSGNTWTFGTTGNLTLPAGGNIYYSNGTIYGSSYANSNVSTFLASFGSNTITTTGNITANYFVGNGSALTGVTVNVAGNIVGTSPNVSLVAGSYTSTFDNTGNLTVPTYIMAGTLRATNASGDEGGELQLTKAPNSTLSGNIVIDQYVDRIRMFDGGGTSRGVYIDLAQASAGVGTLLNNRVSGIVNAGTFVTMDLLKATVTTTGNRGLSLASTTGSFTVNISATYATATNNTAGSAAVVSITTTASTSMFSWNFTGQADMSTYIITDITNSRAYRITLQIGASYNNNLISIERLV